MRKDRRFNNLQKVRYSIHIAAALCIITVVLSGYVPCCSEMRTTKQEKSAAVIFIIFYELTILCFIFFGILRGNDLLCSEA